MRIRPIGSQRLVEATGAIFSEGWLKRRSTTLLQPVGTWSAFGCVRRQSTAGQPYLAPVCKPTAPGAALSLSKVFTPMLRNAAVRTY